VYDSIRPTAYEPDPAAGGWWTEDLYVVAFDERWRVELTSLYPQRFGVDEQPRTLPVRALNTLLRALAPGVMATGRHASTDAEVPWIYSRSPVPEAVIAPVVASWALNRFGDDDRAVTAIAALLEEIPQWEAETVDFSPVPVSRGGTADPDRRLYSLVPDLLAARLAVHPYRPAGAESDIWFRVVDVPEGSEMVSWPPCRYEAKHRVWFYSGYVSITLQTVPFRPTYRVHVTTGIRRWTTNSQADLRNGRTARVLLDVPLPWTETTDERTRAARLITNRIGYQRTLGRVDWLHRSPANLLPDLDITRTYPTALDIAREPRIWLEGRHSVAAGVVHRNGAGDHAVADGLFAGERTLLDSWVEEGLRPLLRRVPDLQRVRITNKPMLLKKAPKSAEPAARLDADRRAANARREALIACLAGRPLNIDIVWRFPDTRRQLLRSIAELLGFPASTEDDAGDQEWQSGGLHIRIHTSELGALGSPLELPSWPGLTGRAALGEAIRARRAAVAARFKRPERGVGLAFAEISERQAFVKDTDPKFALRLGFADTGRLTKFLVAAEDASTKARWTVLDGLRQLGAVTIPALRVGSQVPVNLQYLALWVVRRNRRGPTRMAGERLVAVLMGPGDTTHPVRGWDNDASAWVPYRQLLINLAERVETIDGTEDSETDGRRSRSSQDQRADLERRIRSMLYQVRDRPTLLLANAGNLRHSWHWLRNGSLTIDHLGFGDDEPQRLAVYGPDLRLVVVRDSCGRGEVPQWYAPNGDAVAGLSTGLWAENSVSEDGRVFVSTADKPHTAQGANGVMKLTPDPSGRTSPGRKAWNPQYLELTVVGCLSEKALADAGRFDVAPDAPSTWAAIAHQLRTHDDYVPLATPLPMHLARLAADYVLPTEPDSQDD
jgi:pPIWI_RE module N-terminal domain/RNaseH domain of pPIWI_RE/MID domain of pPIWI_RE